MNLWILLAITWISISVVIADSRWFIQDTPLVGEEGDDPFSSEHLLRVDARLVTKNTAPVKAAKTHEDNRPLAKAQIKKAQASNLPGAGSASISDVESENFLLVNPAGRKPLQAVANNEAVVKMTQETEKSKRGARQEWYIKDDASAEVEGKDGLLPTEQFIRIDKPKGKSAVSLQTNKVKTLTENKKTKNLESKETKLTASVPRIDVEETTEESLIPMQPERASSHSVQNTADKPLTTAQAAVRTSSHNAAAWFVFGSPTDSSDDFAEEHLMRVQTKSKTKSKPVSKPDKPGNIHIKQPKKVYSTYDVTTSPAARHPLEKTVMQIVKSGDFIPTDTQRRGLLQLAAKEKTDHPSVNTPSESVPCDDDKDIDCLMQDEDLILVEKKKPLKPSQIPKLLSKQNQHEPVKEETNVEDKKPKKEVIRREALHRRLLDIDKRSVAPQQKDTPRRLLRELNADEDDDVLPISDDGNEDELQLLNRFRRQSDIETSGDGGFEGEQNITGSTHTVSFNTILNKTVTTLTEEDKARFTQEFVNQTREQFQNFTGFEDIIIKNITLDQQGRVVIDWELALKTSAAPGNTQQKKVQATLTFITETVVPFINNQLNVSGDPVYEKIDANVTEAIASSILGDPCQTSNACPNGFICITDGAFCRHVCYHNGFSDQCRHGSTCQLDSAFNPYCQCGAGYSGEFCETPVQQSTYSTGQVVGAGVAGAVAAAGAAGAIFYFAAYRKKKEEDMEYSYFGEDNQTQASFSDVSSNLGNGNNFYINRPSVTITPLDIYQMNGDHGAMA